MTKSIKLKSSQKKREKVHEQACSNLTKLNTGRMLLDYIEEDTLTDTADGIYSGAYEKVQDTSLHIILRKR